MGMSTTVHYFGKIKSLEMVREFQEEFKEIAQVSGWSHEMVDHVFTQEGDSLPVRMTLKGIRVTLNKSTTSLQLTFDRDGYLSHIYYEKALSEGLKKAGAQVPRQLLHQIHTSTSLRNADAPNHITLVRLLDYVKKRYVPNLEVIDNTGYWYSRDESVLAPKRLELAKK
jgi:hypothetical protein